MNLSELIYGISEIRSTRGVVDCEILGITNDSRTVSPGDLFVAIVGHFCDGHDFSGAAYERGARVFLLERTVELPKDATILISRNARKTSAELLKRLYNFHQSKTVFIGITGTKGKTSVAYLTARLLESVGIPTAAIGTLGVTFQNKTEPVPNTTPDLFFLIPRLAQLQRLGTRAVVMECSSQALADGRIDGLTFDIGVFTSLTPDHIGNGEHPDFFTYRDAKKRLFKEFSIQTAVVNSDDPRARYMSAGIPTVITCSRNDPMADFYPRDTVYRENGTDFFLSDRPFHTSLVGEYNLTNVLLSLAVVKCITGRSQKDFGEVLRDIQIPGRFERYFHKDRLFIIDFAHNADSLEKLCQVLLSLYHRPIILVFGSVGERCEGRRAPLARVAEKYARLSVITADDPGREPIYRILSELHGAFCDKSRAVTIADRDEAIRYAYHVSMPGDIIVLAGKGHERTQRVGEERIPLCESEIIQSL